MRPLLGPQSDPRPNSTWHARGMTVTGSGDDVTARRESVVREHCDAENRHDIKGVVATFAQPHYDVAPLGVPIDGAAAVEGLLGALFTALPDFHAEVTRLHHAADAVIAEVILTGTHQGDWLGIPASGRPVSVRCVSIFDFDGDQLVNESLFFDNATVLTQIGAL